MARRHPRPEVPSGAAMPVNPPTPVRHLAANPWAVTEIALCGARRAAGVGIVKSQRQTTCADCIARKQQQIAAGGPAPRLL